MGSAARYADFHFFGAAEARRKGGAVGGRRRLLGRLSDAVAECDRRRMEREIAAILARSGGRFTDAIEREAFQRQLGSNPWFPV